MYPAAMAGDFKSYGPCGRNAGWVQGFCHPPLCRYASAFATTKNQVKIVVPVQLENAPMGVCDGKHGVNISYKEKGGKTYVLGCRHATLGRTMRLG